MPKRYATMLCAAVCGAVAINMFFLPGNIVVGGATGIATVIYQLTGLPMGLLMFAVNVPILLSGLRWEGKRFLIECLITSGVISLMVQVLSFLPPLTTEPLLASIYGGVVQGICVGLCYRSRMSSGGTELLARILLRVCPGMTAGNMIALLDGSIVVLGCLTLGRLESVLFSGIVVFTTGVVSDFVISGFNRAKQCTIITQKGDEISNALMPVLRRGITELPATGKYTGQGRDVLLIVLTNRQLSQARKMIEQIDPNAFMIVSETTEVMGKGFSEWSTQ